MEDNQNKGVYGIDNLLPLQTDGGQSSGRTSAPGFEGWNGKAKPSDTDAMYTRSYAWRFQDDIVDWDIQIPVSIYEYCTNRARTGEYSIYITDPFQQSFIRSLVDRLETYCQRRSLGDNAPLYAAIAFVQNLDYSLDIDDTGHEAYPKYAIETLVHQRGDCEDGTILLGTLLWEMGYDIAVLTLPDVQHMVLGVASDSVSGTSVEYEGRDYYVIETTDTGWNIGQFPPEYANSSVQPHHPEGQPVLVHEWDATPKADGLVEVTVHVANFSEGTANNLSIQMEFEYRDGDVAARQALEINGDPLEPGDFTKYEGTIRVDMSQKLRGRCQLAIGRLLHDESESDWK